MLKRSKIRFLGSSQADFFDQNWIKIRDVIFWDGKKKLRCKKNPDVKIISIPAGWMVQQVCLQIKIFFTCALTADLATARY